MRRKGVVFLNKFTLGKAKCLARGVSVSENFNCERVGTITPHRLNESRAEAVAQGAKVRGVVESAVLRDSHVRAARRLARYE